MNSTVIIDGSTLHFAGLQAPWLIGMLTSTILLGCIIVQAYDYFTFYDDKRPLKLLVLFLLLVTLADSCCNLYTQYDALILRFGDYTVLTRSSNSNYASTFMAPTIAAPVQVFFAYRSYQVTGNNKILGVVMALLILASTAGGYATSMVAAINGDHLDFNQLLTFIQFWFWSTVAADVTISGIFIYKIYGSRTGFKSTDSVISRLLRLSFQTAALTSLVAVADAIASFSYVESNWQITFYLWLPKLYLISLLTVLNARRQLRLVIEGGATPGRGQSRLNGVGSVRGDKGTGTQIEVHLETFVTVQHDTGDLDPLDEKHVAAKRYGRGINTVTEPEIDEENEIQHPAQAHINRVTFGV